MLSALKHHRLVELSLSPHFFYLNNNDYNIYFTLVKAVVNSKSTYFKTLILKSEFDKYTFNIEKLPAISYSDKHIKTTSSNLPDEENFYSDYFQFYVEPLAQNHKEF